MLARSGSEDNIELDDNKNGTGFHLSEFLPVDSNDWAEFSSEEDELRELQKTNSCNSRIRDKDQRKSSARASYGPSREENFDIDEDVKEKIEERVKPCIVLKNQIVSQNS